MSEVSLKQLRCFVAVYTERNFTRAARVLGMKQSPVSQAIAALERHLDQQLFERGPREAIPTPAAEALYPEALELRRRAESLPQLIAENGDGEVRPRIRMGAASSAFPEIVSVALRTAAEYSVVVSDGASAQLASALDNGDIDLCLIREFGSDRNDERRAFGERLVVALPHDHPLAGRAELSGDEISAEPVVTFSREIAPIAFDLVAGVFLATGAQMRVTAHLSSEQSILALVGAGAGISLVPQSVSLADWKGVTFVPLREAQPTYPLIVRSAPGDPLGLLDPIAEDLERWARDHGIAP